MISLRSSTRTSPSHELRGPNYSVEPLLDSAVNGLPALTLRAFSSDAICSIILVDANHDSFCAILFKAFMSSKSSEFESDFSDLRKLIGLSDNCGIVCCRIIGHPFDEVVRKRSSTYRERVAVLLSVEELRPLIETCYSVRTARHKKPKIHFHSFMESASSVVWAKLGLQCTLSETHPISTRRMGQTRMEKDPIQVELFVDSTTVMGWLKNMAADIPLPKSKTMFFCFSIF